MSTKERPTKRRKLKKAFVKPKQRSTQNVEPFFISSASDKPFSLLSYNKRTFASTNDTIATVGYKSSSIGNFRKRATLTTKSIIEDYRKEYQQALCSETGELYQIYENLQVRIINLDTTFLHTLNPKQKITMEVANGVIGYNKTTEQIAIHAANKYAVFDVKEERWKFGSKHVRVESNFSRLHHCSVVNPKESRMYIFAGMDERQMLTNSMWYYDFKKETWTELSLVGKQCPQPRSDAAFCASADEEYAVLYGGNCEGLLLNDLWQFHFESSSWNRIILGCSIEPIRSPMMTVCSDSKKLMIVGPKGMCTHGTLLDIAPIPSSLSFGLPAAMNILETLMRQRELADVKVILQDGNTKVHKFILRNYSTMKKLGSATNSASEILYELDFTKLGIPLHIFEEYLIPLMYNQQVVPKSEHFLDVIEAAEQLMLNDHATWLKNELARRLQDDDTTALLAHMAIHNSAMKYITLLEEAIANLEKQEKQNLLALLRANVPAAPVMLQIATALMETGQTPDSPDVHPFPQTVLSADYDVYLTDKAKTIRKGAHKTYLMACSDYFRPLFSGQFQEPGTLEEEGNTITLNCGAAALRIFVDILHGNSIKYTQADETDIADLMDFLRLLDELVMEPLLKHCAKQMKRAVPAHHLFEFYNLTKDTETAAFINSTFSVSEVLSML